MKSKPTISINQDITLQVVVSLKEYEQLAVTLTRLDQKFTYEDVTLESMGPDYPIALNRPEVVFRIDTTPQEVSNIIWAIRKTY